MTRHDDRTRLRHMLVHAEEATEMTQGHTRAELDSDRKLNLSLVRLLEIVGGIARVAQDPRATRSGSLARRGRLAQSTGPRLR